MRLHHFLSVTLLGFGLAMTPAFTPILRADDAPKEQPKRGPQQFLERYRAVVDKLNITSEQKPKIDAAFDSAKTKVEAAMKDANGDREAARAKIQPIFKELTEAVVAVLTPEQKEALEKQRAAQRRPTKDSK